VKGAKKVLGGPPLGGGGVETNPRSTGKRKKEAKKKAERPKKEINWSRKNEGGSKKKMGNTEEGGRVIHENRSLWEMKKKSLEFTIFGVGEGGRAGWDTQPTLKRGGQTGTKGPRVEQPRKGGDAGQEPVQKSNQGEDVKKRCKIRVHRRGKGGWKAHPDSAKGGRKNSCKNIV